MLSSGYPNFSKSACDSLKGLFVVVRNKFVSELVVDEPGGREFTHILDLDAGYLE